MRSGSSLPSDGLLARPAGHTIRFAVNQLSAHMLSMRLYRFFVVADPLAYAFLLATARTLGQAQ
jgi:hypothetical protein